MNCDSLTFRSFRSTGYGMLALSCLVSAQGCGDSSVERVPVSGKVLIDGEPLTLGSIRFVPKEGRPLSSAIMADGSFELAEESIGNVPQTGAPVGEYRIQVSASTVVDDKTINWSAPAKYADFRESGLTAKIDRPIDDLVVELEWGDEKPAQQDAADAATTAEEPSNTTSEE
jgi:hypothetical protein